MAYSAEERERLLIAVFTRMKSGQSLMQACAAENVPESTIRLWADKDEDTSAEYARARGALIDSHVNDLLGIADTEPDAARARVQIDTRKWIMSKLMPKRFGDKVAVGGSDEMPPIKNVTRIELIAVKPDDHSED
jgi:hypothetical protein